MRPALIRRVLHFWASCSPTVTECPHVRTRTCTTTLYQLPRHFKKLCFCLLPTGEAAGVAGYLPTKLRSRVRVASRRSVPPFVRLPPRIGPIEGAAPFPARGIVTQGAETRRGSVSQHRWRVEPDPQGRAQINKLENARRHRVYREHHSPTACRRLEGRLGRKSGRPSAFGGRDREPPASQQSCINRATLIV